MSDPLPLPDPLPAQTVPAANDASLTASAPQPLSTPEARIARLAGIGYWELDPVRERLYVSPTFFHLLGYGPETPVPEAEWQYHTCLQRIHGSERDELVQRLAQLQAGTVQTGCLRLRIRHQYGIWHWFEVNLCATADAAAPDAGPSGILLTFKDISEFKQVEAAAIDSQIRYRSLYRTSPLALMLWDREGRITEWNQKAEEAFGWRSEEVIGKPIHKLLFPDASRQAFAQSVRKLVQGEGDGRFTTDNLCKDGQNLHCEWSSVVLRNNKGVLLGIMSLVLDLSERRRAEQAQHAEERARQRELSRLVEERTQELENAHLTLKRIIESSPIPMFVLNTDNIITHWNRACEQTLHYTAEEMVGTRRQWEPFYETMRPVLADLVMGADKNTLAGLYPQTIRPSSSIDGAFESERYFQRLNRWFAFNAVPLRDAVGNIIGAIETLTDTTERHEAEDALREAKQLADSAARVKAEFLANMSHEIRTPMNAVIGLAYLLLKTELNPRQHDYVVKIHSAGKLLLGLVNDVLDFSKIEAGKLHIEQTRFVLDDVLNNVATLVQASAQEKHLELHFAVAPDVPRQMQGDPLRISQVLVNLISNAVKFTPEGFVGAFIQVRERKAQGMVLEVAIQDSGIGITEAQRSKLFQAFAQADASTSRKYGGTGLGLVIARRLVNLMGGDFHLTSQPGKGSIFSFTLLLGYAPEDTDTGLAPMATAVSGSGGEPAGERFALVVDDHPLARTVVVGLLKKLGYQARTADSGEAALALLRQPHAQAFDWIFLDWNMPGLDGLAVARAIRHEIRPAPRIMMITGAQPETLEEAATLGEIDAVLTKPVIYAQLAKVLNTPAGSTVAAAQPRPVPQHHPLRGMKVLLVEDIPTNQLIASEIIESLGASVQVAQNGIDALNRIGRDPYRFDVVLMDIQMPEMDGLEATRRLRATPGMGRLPIIAMTAHAMDDERERCHQVGMDDFLTKPIEPSALAATLVRWQRHSKNRPAEPATAMPSPSAAGEGEPASPPGFIALPGIDTEDGLRRMLNKPALYEKVLKDFYRRFWNETSEIHQALQTGDQQTALRRAHSIKGLAGSIGAKNLQQAALSLEQGIRNHDTAENLPLSEFAAQLNLVINGLNAAYHLDDD